VWADEALMRGLALASQASLHRQPQSAEAWLEGAEPGEHWIVIDAFATPDRQPDTWRALAEQLEQSWFAPLLAALSARRVREVTLATVQAGRALRLRVAWGDLWKLWRRRVSSAHG
jgi:hypothetical protein